MAIATGLISSLINIASSQNVPYHQPQPLKCMHHGATFEPLSTQVLVMWCTMYALILKNCVSIFVMTSWLEGIMLQIFIIILFRISSKIVSLCLILCSKSTDYSQENLSNFFHFCNQKLQKYFIYKLMCTI